MFDHLHGTARSSAGGKLRGKGEDGSPQNPDEPTQTRESQATIDQAEADLASGEGGAEKHFEGGAQIAKLDEDRHLVFGWQSVTVDKSGRQVVDSQGDMIATPDLEDAVYDFVLHSRRGGEMHRKREDGDIVVKAALVESIVFTAEKLAALGIPNGTVPEGWWAGYHIQDDAVWEKVKSGEYRAFSIGGSGVRVPA
ncbi:MAG: hypothetical protein KGL39_17500 [Patescibacteria group bacterium]|nr:hypothetical protein [Patescibacteria group bacterium]